MLAIAVVSVAKSLSDWKEPKLKPEPAPAKEALPEDSSIPFNYSAIQLGQLRTSLEYCRKYNPALYVDMVEGYAKVCCPIAPPIPAEAKTLEDISDELQQQKFRVKNVISGNEYLILGRTEIDASAILDGRNPYDVLSPKRTAWDEVKTAYRQLQDEEGKSHLDKVAAYQYIQDFGYKFWRAVYLHNGATTWAIGKYRMYVPIA